MIGNKKDDSGIFYLSIFILLSLVTNKFFFTFYHFLISLMVIIPIGIILIFFIKKNLKNELKSVSIFALFIYIISFVAIIAPNGNFLKLMQDADLEFISYKKLTWNDFKGEPEMDSKFDAAISSEIRYKVNSLSEYAIILQMSKKESWKKDKVTDANTNLLGHEQGHFDLKKIFYNRIKDSIQSREQLTEREFKSIMDFWYQELEKTDSLYDLETGHNLNQKQQFLWNDFIKKEFENIN